MIDNTLDKIDDVMMLLEDKPICKRFVMALATIVGVIVGLMIFIFGSGWIVAYDISTIHDDWTKYDDVFTYAANMLFVIVYGALVHCLFLICLSMIVAACCIVCYYGWFIVLPLALAFLGICFGRWLYLRKRRIQLDNNA